MFVLNIQKRESEGGRERERDAYMRVCKHIHIATFVLILIASHMKLRQYLHLRIHVHTPKHIHTLTHKNTYIYIYDTCAWTPNKEKHAIFVMKSGYLGTQAATVNPDVQAIGSWA